MPPVSPLRYLLQAGAVSRAVAQRCAARLPDGSRTDEAIADELIRETVLTAWQWTQAQTRKVPLVWGGRYMLLDELGQGGMGTVYLARRRADDELVAVKAVHPHCHNDPDLQHRFRREVKLGQKLDHPNIVRALDVGEQGQTVFVVLEYIDGIDLHDLVTQQGIPDVADTARYVRDAALALDYAHRHGVIHRDVKPRNLRLSTTGQVKLLDLGLARVVHDSTGSGASQMMSQVTVGGTLLGTLEYMAPEQAIDAHAVDFRADVYSLGATLYFLLSGRAPVTGGNYLELLYNLANTRPTPLGQLSPDCPPSLAETVDRMLARNPDDRFQSCEEVATSLQAFVAAASPTIVIPSATQTPPRSEQERDTDLPRTGLTRTTRETVIGIDLGTTVSLLARLDDLGRPRTFVNRDGDLLTPSVVFLDEPEVLVGRDAIRAIPRRPEAVAYAVKRSIGSKHYPRPICGRLMSPAAIQALILRQLVQDAEGMLGSIGPAVLAVPAYFNEVQRTAMRNTVRLAGLKLLDLIDEPIAAALSYGLRQGLLDEQIGTGRQERFLVFDLGGGTFEATIVQLQGSTCRRLANAGDVHLGGFDWDSRLAHYLAEQYRKRRPSGHDLRQDPAIWLPLVYQAEAIKKTLSTQTGALAVIEHAGRRVEIPVDRQEFDAMTADLVERTLSMTAELLRSARMTWKDITRLLLVGGSTRIPAVRHAIEKASGLKAESGVSVDEAVAHGAALYANQIVRRGAPAEA